MEKALDWHLGVLDLTPGFAMLGESFKLCVPKLPISKMGLVFSLSPLLSIQTVRSPGQGLSLAIGSHCTLHDEPKSQLGHLGTDIIIIFSLFTEAFL